jgi:CRP-like cAMP-binding protein
VILYGKNNPFRLTGAAFPIIIKYKLKTTGIQGGAAMISPELLRRYPFFGRFSESQLKALAMIGEEVTLEDKQMVLEEGKPAQALFFLLEGGIDLYYSVEEPSRPNGLKELPVCEINVGEPFGISALIEPHILTSTGRSSGESRVIRFDAQALHSAMSEDPQLELVLLRAMSKAALQRLHATRVQLAAAWT